MRAEGLDDDVPQTAVRVNGRFVGFLAGLWEFFAAEMDFDLVRKLLAG
jgi:hypothetical protein